LTPDAATKNNMTSPTTNDDIMIAGNNNNVNSSAAFHSPNPAVAQETIDPALADEVATNTIDDNKSYVSAGPFADLEH